MASSSFEDIVSGDVFKFIVGAGGQTFYLHSDVVARQSPALDTFINGRMKEAIVRTVVWENIDVPTFVRFASFLYTGDYQPAATQPRFENPEQGIYHAPLRDLMVPRRLPFQMLQFAPAQPINDFHPWVEFQRLYPEPPHEATVGSPADDHTDAFVSIAKVYVLADCYGAYDLRELSLRKLRKALVEFILHPAAVPDVTELIRYTYENTVDGGNGPRDELRDLVNLYATCKAKELMENDEFAMLLGKFGGDFSKALTRGMVRRFYR